MYICSSTINSQWNRQEAAVLFPPAKGQDHVINGTNDRIYKHYKTQWLRKSFFFQREPQVKRYAIIQFQTSLRGSHVRSHEANLQKPTAGDKNMNMSFFSTDQNTDRKQFVLVVQIKKQRERISGNVILDYSTTVVQNTLYSTLFTLIRKVEKVLSSCYLN